MTMTGVSSLAEAKVAVLEELRDELSEPRTYVELLEKS